MHNVSQDFAASPLITFPYLFLRLFLTAVYTHDYGPSTQQSIETPQNPVSKVELAWFASNNHLWWGRSGSSCLERFQFSRRGAEQHPISNTSWMGRRRAKQHPIILSARKHLMDGPKEKTGFIENTSLACCCCCWPFTDTLLPPKIVQRGRFNRENRKIANNY